MFIAQVMYAEGLAKILKAILRVKKQEEKLRIKEIERKIEVLESAQTILKALPLSSSWTAVTSELAAERENLKRVSEQFSKQHPADLALLERCGIKPEEFEKKFRLISADCTRISHGSVKPPIWEAA
jgi:hypothetical protein